MTIKTRTFAVVLSLLVLFAMTISTLPAWGQANATGTVIGVVTDPSGAVVPGATVTMTDNATGTAHTATTNDQGRYVFVNALPGSYTISVSKAGFAAAKVTNQVVQVGQQLTANVQLQVGQASTEVVVEGQAAATLQTLNATVGDTISGAQISEVPNLGRDVSTLTVLQPGVSPQGNVAGAILDQNTYQLDGGNNTNDMDGSMNIYTPSFASDPSNNGYNGGPPTGVMPTPVESIEEFKVATNNQTADFNGSSGGQIQMVTKRGTNQWHGAVYDYYYSSWGGANTWDNNNTVPATPLTKFHRNRFGASGGGTILPKLLGGKTYLFANYEGSRFPNSQTWRALVPSATMRAGIVGLSGIAGSDCAAANGIANGGNCFYNLNPNPVTVGGVTYPVANCAGGPCDPRGLGISPTIQGLWAKYMPLPNDFNKGDKGLNTATYDAPLLLGQTDNFGVVRLDHDFGDKWHFMSSYRYYHLLRASSAQVDVGGALKGDTFGVPAAKANRPQVPWYLVAGMTTNITSNTTNDFHFSYLRNYWAWASSQDVPQPISGLNGALEIGGETSSALIPYNVNAQSVRTRFWDGQDTMFRDDLNILKGNHLFQMGGTIERNFDYHQRTDNGGGVMINPVYQVKGLPTGVMGAYAPAGLSASQLSKWSTQYGEMLGIVAQSQNLYTRLGQDLHLLPQGTPAFDQSQINSYNVYFSDTWHLKPTFTLTYGLGYELQLPPRELNGKQVMLVDQGGLPVSTNDYFQTKMRDALNGTVYNPTIGFATVGNVGSGRKYPYDTYYGGFSPRVSAAWNPTFNDGLLSHVFGKDSTVIRGGWSRLYGRLNGVDLVLVPLLGTGLMQPVQCVGVNMNGSCAGSTTGVNPTDAFRIGPTAGGWDGLNAPIAAAQPTLPQPYYPGTPIGNPTGALNPAAGAGEALDPHFQPSISDQFDFTIQRALSSKVTLELGYIGRKLSHEYQAFNLDAVPYMMTFGGQSFASAYANIEKSIGCTVNTNTCGAAVPSDAAGLTAYANALPKQAFFENAINPAFCTGFSSCTAAVFANESSNFAQQTVYDMWSDLESNLGAFKFGRSMPSSVDQTCGGVAGCVPAVSNQVSSIFLNASTGWSNYNAGFASLKVRDWHGATLGSTFTYSKSLGTNGQVQSSSEFTEVDSYVLKHNYGLQAFDQTFILNTYATYATPWFKSQQGLFGRVLGGWNISPLFTAQSGYPDEVGMYNCEAGGEGNCNDVYAWENAVKVASIPNDNTRHANVPGSNGVGTNGVGFNLFKNPEAVYNSYRPWILGLDSHTGAAGNIRGMPNWNMDLSVSKDFRIVERVGATFTALFLNVLNHNQMSDPYMNITDPNDWGVINGQLNTPRRMEFGLRLHF